MVAAVNRAVFPGYAKIAQDLERIRDGFMRVIGLISLVLVPASAGLAAVAHDLVLVALGEQWLAGVEVVWVMAWTGLFTGLQTNTVYVLLALNRPRLVTALGGLHLAVLLPLLWLMVSRADFLGAAYAMLIAAAGNLLVVYVILVRHLEMGVTDYLRSLWRPSLAAALMYFAVTAAAEQLMAADMAPILRLLLCVVLGALVYHVAVLALWRLSGRPDGAEQFVRGRAGEMLPGTVCRWIFAEFGRRA